jgi:hypothetical protein
MRLTEVIDLARRKSKTNSSTFSDSDMLLYLKAKIPQFQSDIEKANEDYMGSIEFRDLRPTGDGTYTDNGEIYISREYNLPTDMISRLKFVSAKLDGENWIRLKQYDLNDIKIPFEEKNILEHFNNTQGIAGYEIFRGSLFLLTGEIKEEVPDGLKIWTYSYSALPTVIPVAGSEQDVDLDVYGIPEIMHELLATALCIEWKNNLETPVPLTINEQNYYDLYEKALRSLRALDRDQEVQFSRPADKYNKGFNL